MQQKSNKATHLLNSEPNSRDKNVFQVEVTKHTCTTKHIVRYRISSPTNQVLLLFYYSKKNISEI